jgi:hypothetical protein
MTTPCRKLRASLPDLFDGGAGAVAVKVAFGSLTLAALRLGDGPAVRRLLTMRSGRGLDARGL